MMYRHILACLSLVLFMPLSVKALPPASPAGGNYLALDGVDDYAVLDFETFGMLLPEGTDEFTVEAWIYPTKPPDEKGAALTILSQQVRMRVVSDEFQPLLNNVANALNIEPPKGNLILIMNAHLQGRGFGTSLFFPIPLVPNQWYHIAFQAKQQQTTTIVNELVRTLQHATPLGHNGFLRPKDFVLGGFGKKIEIAVKNNPWFWGSFIGYIDEVRISTEARYDVGKKGFMPRGAFKNDAKTVALWHFDEPEGTVDFSDASGNAYHLVGENGAKTGIPLAVEAAGKLATTWGRLKQ